jgi:D-3-phosphoglycerate dehydrogenase / 2-oxoglutarate reductase
MTDQAAFLVGVQGDARRLQTLGRMFEAEGCQVVRIATSEAGECSWDGEPLASLIPALDARVGTFAQQPLTRAVLERGERLRVVTSPIIGTEHIDVDSCTALGIVVGFGSIEANYVGVAEAVAMEVAALLKRLVPKMDAVRSGGWLVDDVGRMVRGSTVGLIGLGAIGAAVARRLAGWECLLLATDPYVTRERAGQCGVELVPLERLLTESDVVSVMVTLTEETQKLLGEKELALMKAGSYLITTSRGGVVDEVALEAAIRGGQLAGAAVDTWAEEPSRSSLREDPRVIATGHNVGHSRELYEQLPPAAIANTMQALHGQPPWQIRNPEVLPRWRERVTALDRAAHQAGAPTR